MSIVELDIACGDPAAVLELARLLALSLRHLGLLETQFELLVMTFVALLVSGELAEARATGAELLESRPAAGPQQAVHRAGLRWHTWPARRAAMSRPRGSHPAPMLRMRPRASYGVVPRRSAARTVVTTLDKELGAQWRELASRLPPAPRRACGLLTGPGSQPRLSLPAAAAAAVTRAAWRNRDANLPVPSRSADYECG